MTSFEIIIWTVLPYVAITIFIVGHIWRYRKDKFGWTSRSSQLQEKKILAWGSNLFHYGALAAIGGHVIGILIPQSWTQAVGISESLYHNFSAYAGAIAGLVTFVGLVILLYRRISNSRIGPTTTSVDLVVYSLLTILIILGLSMTIGVNLLGPTYNYRPTVGVWFRDIFLLNPHPSLMANAPELYQLHAFLAWFLFALWPFSRLVHVWSVPVWYIGRPYILYRSRYKTPPLGEPSLVESYPNTSNPKID